MVGLFRKRSSRDSYYDMSKYSNEASYNRSIPQSPSSSGLAAAAAALRMHSSPVQAKPVQPARSNSLTNRNNSLRQYTYHPKPSYTVGQAIIQNARRYSSLTNKVNSYAQVPDEDMEETVVTTTTTKVVDSHGRTQSITTRTVTTLPDGSNIIETTTKNISRTSSRANSLSSGNNPRVNSLTHATNLAKIDEQLQNFEYDYQIDSQHLDNPDMKLKLNLPDNANQSSPKEISVVEPKHEKTESHSIASQEKPRSILKNTRRPSMSESYEPLNDTSPKSPSNSITFNDKVKTIPVHTEYKTKNRPQSYVKPQQTPRKEIPDSEFYAAAMQAAYKKVYGDKPPETPASSPVPIESPKKSKLGIIPISPRIASNEKHEDHKPMAAKHDGEIPGDYRYHEHHRQFAIHSMRENVVGTSRKERIKEEKKLAKEKAKEEKRLAKERVKEEKRLAKEREQEEKRLAKEREKEEKRLAKEREQEHKRLEKEREEEEKSLAREKVEEENKVEKEQEEKRLKNEREQLAKGKEEEQKCLEEKREQKIRLVKEKEEEEKLLAKEIEQIEQIEQNQVQNLLIKELQQLSKQSSHEKPLAREISHTSEKSSKKRGSKLFNIFSRHKRNSSVGSSNISQKSISNLHVLEIEQTSEIHDVPKKSVVDKNTEQETNLDEQIQEETTKVHDREPISDNFVEVQIFNDEEETHEIPPVMDEHEVLGESTPELTHVKPSDIENDNVSSTKDIPFCTPSISLDQQKPQSITEAVPEIEPIEIKVDVKTDVPDFKISASEQVQVTTEPHTVLSEPKKDVEIPEDNSSPVSEPESGQGTDVTKATDKDVDDAVIVPPKKKSGNKLKQTVFKYFINKY